MQKKEFVPHSLACVLLPGSSLVKLSEESGMRLQSSGSRASIP